MKIPRQYLVIGFAGTGVLLIWILSFFAGHGITQLGNGLHPPSSTFWWGSDFLGRSVFSRAWNGLGVSVLCWMTIQAISLLMGVVVGLAAGWRQGAWLDVLIRGVMSMLWSIPMLMLLMSVFAVLGTGLPQLILTIAAINWVTFARIVRGETISLRKREFVQAAEALGMPARHILFHEILPHLAPPLAVTFLFSTIDVVGIEAGLSFLGMGIPPALPSLGGLLRQGMDFIASAWWLAFFPGLVLVSVILLLNIAGTRMERRFARRSL